MLCSRGQEWGREGCHSHHLFKDFIHWHEVLLIQIWSWYLHWLQNGKLLTFWCTFFNCFMKWNWRPLSLKCWHFEASEDIMTKFKSQGLHIIRIKSWNDSGSGFPPSLFPALQKFAILGLKTGLRQWYNGISVCLLLKTDLYYGGIYQTPLFLLLQKTPILVTSHVRSILKVFWCLLVWPQWWSFADVSQQGLDFSKKISKTKMIFWFDFHRCSHGSSKSG